jgi:hypothetical protein
MSVIVFRNEQEGSVTVDNGTTVTKRSPGKLRQLNTNTGLYIGNDTTPCSESIFANLNEILNY